MNAEASYQACVIPRRYRSARVPVLQFEVITTSGSRACPCRRHHSSRDCARKTAEQTDPNLKQDFLELEESWLFLARSFKFNERLGDSSDVMNRRKSYEFVQSIESFVLDAHGHGS
jgi:hypothetical protein